MIESIAVVGASLIVAFIFLWTLGVAGKRADERMAKIMADAKKCDLCGAFYMPKEKGPRTETGKKTLVLNEYDEEGYFRCEYDFCPECQEKFEAIVRGFLEREVLKSVDSTLEKIDIFGPGRVG